MMTDVAPDLDALSAVLRRGGVEAGLAFLNHRVAHRYTAIYRLQAMTVRNLFLYDREGGQLPPALSVAPLTDSFCQHVLREGAFLCSDTRQDPRADGSPYQGVVIAYHGLPLRDGRGQLFGSLSHFDVVPRGLGSDELAFMRLAAELLPAFLPRH